MGQDGVLSTIHRDRYRLFSGEKVVGDVWFTVGSYI